MASGTPINICHIWDCGQSQLEHMHCAYWSDHPLNCSTLLITLYLQSYFQWDIIQSSWGPELIFHVTSLQLFSSLVYLHVQPYSQLTEAQQHLHRLRFNSAHQHCLYCIHQTLTLGNETRQVADMSQPHLSHLY